MPHRLQKKILKGANSKVNEKFIFSSYCPRAPHNTTQYLMADYNLRIQSQPQSYLYETLMNTSNLSAEEDGSSISDRSEAK